MPNAWISKWQKTVTAIDYVSASSPAYEAECSGLLDVQVVTIEEVPVHRTADVDARVGRLCSEDQQAEETDGESTPQPATVRDTVRVKQAVAMVICQGSGLLGATQMFPKEPDNWLDLKTHGELNN